MKQTIIQFNENIERIKTLHSVYKLFDSKITNLIDISDILRAEIVLLVSAVDFYIHQIVKIGMLEVFNGIRPETKSFKNYSISLNVIREAILNPGSSDWLESEIVQRHGWRSFQEASKISEALRLISDVDIWKAVALDLNRDAEEVKKSWNLIVDRRNKIAHEADLDPSFPETRWPIDEPMVFDSINFVSQLVNTIHKALT